MWHKGVRASCPEPALWWWEVCWGHQGGLEEHENPRAEATECTMSLYGRPVPAVERQAGVPAVAWPARPK